MGTPDFAVPSLKVLAEDPRSEIVGVITQPDRPAGRGNRLTACPVKQYALEAGLPVYQFERIRRPEGVERMKALAPDVCVTAAFGQILTQELLDIPVHGTVNVHASLLPKHRGSAPINWCILMGETVTGVTIMRTDAGIDTGEAHLHRQTFQCTVVHWLPVAIVEAVVLILRIAHDGVVAELVAGTEEIN